MKTSIFAKIRKICGLIEYEVVKMNQFGRILIEWYECNKRDLPWRQTKDPYKIWISEVILQQTRVAQGYDYYCRFIERFPDFHVLAEADDDEVMKYWQGLGYYSRARNLLEAARSIRDRSTFPDTYEEVRALKGVGEYTAAAICSIAYDMPYAVVDGNVYRVLSRWMGVDTPIDTSSGKKVFAELATEWLMKEHPGVYNQAIMDFGALQCVPVSPQCETCPLIDSCVAYRERRVNLLPKKQRKIKVLERYFIYLYVHASEYTYLYKRSAGDIWQNLYEFPLIEPDRDVLEEEFFFLSELHSLLGATKVNRIRKIGNRVKHVLSHRVIYADCYEVEVDKDCVLSGAYQKVLVDDLHKFPVSRLLSHFFSLILNSDIKTK